MKNSGVCPKCSGRSLIKIPGEIGPHGSGNNIQVGSTMMSLIPVVRFLCATCGYSEEWVERFRDLEEIQAKFGVETRADES